MDIQLRKLTPKDAEIFRTLRLTGLLESPESFGRTWSEYSQTTTQEIAEAITKSAPGFILGAFFEDILIGVTGMSRKEGEHARHRMHLWGMYVDQKFRKRGIARKLLKEAIRYASEIPGIEIIELAVVTSNISATKLYRSAGFTPWGIEPKSFRIEDGYLDLEYMFLEVDEKRSSYYSTI